MSESDETFEEAGSQEPQQDSRHFARLRGEKEALETENKALKAANARLLAEQSGFETSTELARMALSNFTEGREADGFTPEAFKEYAERIGLPAVKQETTSTGDANAQALDALQAQADAVKAQTSQALPPDINQQIAEAEANRDVAKAIALKDQLMAQQFAPKVPA